MNRDELRGKLFDLDGYPEDLKTAIREEIGRVRERPLKTWEKALWVAKSAILGVILAGFALSVVVEWERITTRAPRHMVAALLIMGVLIVGALIFSLLDLRRGAQRPRNMRLLVYAGAALMIFMYVFALVTDRPVTGDDLGAYLIFAVLIVVIHIDKAELRMHERSLRNELALVRLAELVAEQKPAPPQKS